MTQIGYVNLSTGKIRKEHISDEILKAYLGGRGLNAYLLYKHMKRDADPLGPDNVLIFGAGLLNGYLGVSNGRWHVTAKSPETGVNGDSNAGGFFGSELAHAGYPHLVIEGKSSHPVYLWVHDGEIEIKDASHLWGKDTYETQQLINDELSDPEVQSACIGQAGEKLVRFSCVRHGLKRAAGRTGMGTVMGSKNLKAVAARGNLGLKVHNPKAALEAANSIYKRITGSKMYPILSRYGTLSVFAMQNGMGMLAVKNHQLNYCKEAEGTLEAEIFLEKYNTRFVTCSSCPIHCTHRYLIETGPYAGVYSEGPEWYVMGGFGPDLGSVDWEVVLVANDLCNRYGLDIGSASAYIAWLMELWQRKIIDKKFTGGLNLDWGNKETIIELLHQMALRQGLGGKMAEGWKPVADQIGQNAEYYMLHSKGLPMESCNDCRPLRATTLGESTSNRGYDHLRGRAALEFFGLPEEVLEKIYGKPIDPDFASWRGKPWMAVWTQRLTSIADSLGICKFSTVWPGSVNSQAFPDFSNLLKAYFGWDLSAEQMWEVADRIWNVERLFNIRESSYRRDGDMPPQRYYEPYPLNPLKGFKTDREDYEKALNEYYDLMGWNYDGTPKKATLEKLGIVG